MYRRIASVLFVVVLAAACGNDNGGGGRAARTTRPATTLLASRGPCDPAKPPYPVGMIETVESSVVSLKQNALALEAAVEAFNARGGVGGHCMELTICDSEADPNKEVDCARQFVDKGIVATLADTTTFNPQGVKEVFEAAGLPRVGLSATPQELASSVSYPFSAGAAGATFVEVPACTRNGHTKLAAIHLDSPVVGAVFTALEPTLEAYGAEFVYKAAVPAGTTDFQQFTLSAERAGATCAILPLGQNEIVQVLRAAQQLGTKMTFSLTPSNLGRADVADFGAFASQLYFNHELPPITGDQTRWPILREVIADLEASGAPEMRADRITGNAFRSWVAVYFFVRIVEDFGRPDDISRQAVTAAIKAARDLDSHGLLPPWTPSFSVTGGKGAFASVSQPWYRLMSFDAAAKRFEVSDRLVNVIAELQGRTDYPQPSAAPGSSPTTTAS